MHSVAWWPTVFVLAVATVTDLRSRRIPNWLVLPFLLAGILVHGWLHGWPGVGRSFEGLSLGLVLYGILFLMGGMGAGDVKLCAAIGAWIGPLQLIMALIVTGLAGGIMVLGWAIRDGFLKEMFADARDLLFGWTGWRTRRRDAESAGVDPEQRKMPYAPAIAVGTLVSFFVRFG
jgi:prepilin peptidase CpaA